MIKNILFSLLVATAAFADRPMTFEDMAAMHRIGDPQVSPDGKWVAYDVSIPDLKANKSVASIWLVPADGSAPSKQIIDGSGPAWSPDGKSIAYTRDQAYVYDMATGGSRKVTDLPGGAGSVKWAPDGS